MSEEKQIELKPCPFCGGTEFNFRERDHSVKDNATEVRLWCDRCGASTDYRDTKEKAVKAWNRRADNDQRKAD